MSPAEIERLKELLPTSLGSAEVREQIAADILRRSVFSARMECARYLAEVRDVVSEMLEGTLDQAADDRYKLALVYAVRHSREPEAFAGLDSVAAIERTIKKDFRTLAATPAEVNAALESVLGLRPRPPSDVEGAALSWAALCARLETQTGIPARDWMWKHSSAYSVKCYHDLHDFARSYCSAKGTSTHHMADELDDAVNALQRLKVEIRDRVRRGDGD